jgi:RND superfamily putative drug exporter
MSLTPQTAVRAKQPVTVKIANWSARHRWTVFGLWFVLMFGLMIGSTLVPAAQKAKDNYAGLDFESAKAYQALKAGGGEADPGENFFLVVNHPTLKTTDPAFKATVDQMTNTLSQFSYTEDGKTQPLFSKLYNPYQVPPQAGLISADQTTVRIYGWIAGEAHTEKWNKRIEPFQQKLDDLKKQYPDYKVVIASDTLNFLAENKEALESMNHSLLVTLIPTFLILLLVFGAVVAAAVPLVLALTSVVGAVGIVTMYSRLSGDDQISNAMILCVLMGLAVAVDYSLFIISRYRTERYHGREKLAALEIASGTAGRAVFFSGVLVAISISGLFILGSIFTSMAIGVIAVVLVSVLGSFTFLPAMLSILGKGINWGRIPYFGRPREEGKGIWSKIVHAVMRRPVVTTLIAASLLIFLATPLLHIKLGFSQNNSDTLERVRASKLLNEKWPQGSELKLQVVVTQADQPQTQEAIKQFETAALQIPGLSGPVERIPSADGKVVMLSFLQSGGWNDQANQDIVRKVRSETIPAYFGNLPDTKAYVTGFAASVVDQVKYFMNPIVWVFVLGLSFLVLLVVFRSLVIPVKALILNLLSTGAAYGVVIFIFQDGNLGVQSTQVMEAWLPVFIFTIVFGLSMDYHMFILTRIKEMRDKGQSSNDAVANAISITSSTITGAAAIMVVVFGDFFFGMTEPSIRQLGLGLAVAVLLDATVVRCLLLPAVMKLLGEANWWMPKFLNWLPTITIESEPEHTPALPVEEPEAEEVAA